jgi:hypothetical protein
MWLLLLLQALRQGQAPPPTPPLLHLLQLRLSQLCCAQQRPGCWHAWVLDAAAVALAHPALEGSTPPHSLPLALLLPSSSQQLLLPCDVCRAQQQRVLGWTHASLSVQRLRLPLLLLRVAMATPPHCCYCSRQQRQPRPAQGS